MKLKANHVSKEIWDIISQKAHTGLFGNLYSEDFKKYDFTILVTNEDDEQVCYSMVKEIDAESAFLTFGGTFEPFRGKNLTVECLKKISESLLAKYKYLGFCCRANNAPMVKVGLDCGYKIIGLLEIYGLPNLEFLLERGE